MEERYRHRRGECAEIKSEKVLKVEPPFREEEAIKRGIIFVFVIVKLEVSKRLSPTVNKAGKKTTRKQKEEEAVACIIHPPPEWHPEFVCCLRKTTKQFYNLDGGDDDNEEEEEEDSTLIKSVNVSERECFVNNDNLVSTYRSTDRPTDDNNNIMCPAIR